MSLWQKLKQILRGLLRIDDCCNKIENQKKTLAELQKTVKDSQRRFNAERKTLEHDLNKEFAKLRKDIKDSRNVEKSGFLQSCLLIAEPEKLLSNQYSGEDFDGYDIIVKYMAIKDIERGINDDGVNLYTKMFAAREMNSIYNIERFKDLIQSFKENEGFALEKPIEVSSSGIIIDGSHRLACALYFRCPFVSVLVKSENKKARNFSLDFFKEHEFSEYEIKCIIEHQRKIFFHGGCFTSILFWVGAEENIIEFETLVERNQKFRIIAGNKIYLSKDELLESGHFLLQTGLQGMSGIDSILDVFQSKSDEKIPFYIYWYETSNSDPTFNTRTGELENKRVLKLQRSLQINVTEDEALRKGIRWWYVIHTDHKINQQLMSFSKQYEACEIDISIAELRGKIFSIFYSEKQKFGRGQLYQSFPPLGIDGQRPTDERIKEYGLKEIIKDHFNVLDIGCNCGFLDIMIAENAHKITGIDLNESLIEIGRLAANALQIKNVEFYVADFNSWEAGDAEKYDVIFSFAVHNWLKTTPGEYAARLYSLLNKEGYVLFESHRLDTIDLEFDSYCSAFLNLGMSVVQEGKIRDDSIIERRWLVFQK